MNIYLKQFINKKFKTCGFNALDLGEGEGYDVACLEHDGWNVWGVDKKSSGTDLNKPFLCGRGGTFDLIYSNYVLHRIKNKEVFIDSIYNNLKDNGKFFLHLIHIPEEEINELLKDKFKNIKYEHIKHFDNDIGHKHWHRILEVTGEKIN